MASHRRHSRHRAAGCCAPVLLCTSPRPQLELPKPQKPSGCPAAQGSAGAAGLRCAARRAAGLHAVLGPRGTHTHPGRVPSTSGTAPSAARRALCSLRPQQSYPAARRPALAPWATVPIDTSLSAPREAREGPLGPTPGPALALRAAWGAPWGRPECSAPVAGGWQRRARPWGTRPPGRPVAAVLPPAADRSRACPCCRRLSRQRRGAQQDAVCGPAALRCVAGHPLGS